MKNTEANCVKEQNDQEVEKIIRCSVCAKMLMRVCNRTHHHAWKLKLRTAVYQQTAGKQRHEAAFEEARRPEVQIARQHCVSGGEGSRVRSVMI